MVQTSLQNDLVSFSLPNPLLNGPLESFNLAPTNQRQRSKKGALHSLSLDHPQPPKLNLLPKDSLSQIVFVDPLQHQIAENSPEKAKWLLCWVLKFKNKRHKIANTTK